MKPNNEARPVRISLGSTRVSLQFNREDFQANSTFEVIDNVPSEDSSNFEHSTESGPTEIAGNIISSSPSKDSSAVTNDNAIENSVESRSDISSRAANRTKNSPKAVVSLNLHQAGLDCNTSIEIDVQTPPPSLSPSPLSSPSPSPSPSPNLQEKSATVDNDESLNGKYFHELLIILCGRLLT